MPLSVASDDLLDSKRERISSPVGTLQKGPLTVCENLHQREGNNHWNLVILTFAGENGLDSQGTLGKQTHSHVPH